MGRHRRVVGQHTIRQTFRPGKLTRFPGLFLFLTLMNQTSSNFSLLAAGVVTAGLAIALLSGSVHGQIAVRNQGYVPFSDAPINYRGDVNDPVARLQRQLDTGETVAAVGAAERLSASRCSSSCAYRSARRRWSSRRPASNTGKSRRRPRARSTSTTTSTSARCTTGRRSRSCRSMPRQGAIFYLLDEPQDRAAACSSAPSSIARRATSPPARATSRAF